MLCLSGTVTCNYRGARYNIPIEIFVPADYPTVSPLVYVRPTSDMHISPTSRDVLSDGKLVIPYIRNWNRVKSFNLRSFLEHS